MKLKGKIHEFSRLTGAIAALALMLAAAPAVAQTAGKIAGSNHDFSASGWSGGQICVVCHTPHNSNTGVTDAPLWNHATTAATFTPYASPTMNATAALGGQPAGTSKLCLSCHDGTIAVDSFGGATGTTKLTGNANIGTNLSNDHPISIVYDAALATLDGGLNNPAATTVTVGSGAKTKTGTIAELLLPGGSVQCASCHDVHNTYVDGGSLLKVTSAGSKICLVCHNK
jgi:predicted CXXCH cytochrome family protein